MLTTIEAEIDVNGSVTFLEPLKISKKVGRLLRSLKYEDSYLHDYQNGWELDVGVASYAHFYNTERPHEGLDMKIPYAVHYGAVS